MFRFHAQPWDPDRSQWGSINTWTVVVSWRGKILQSLPCAVMSYDLYVLKALESREGVNNSPLDDCQVEPDFQRWLEL